MSKEFEAVDLPILIEPSNLFCLANGKKCKHRDFSYGDYFCGKKGKSITISGDKWRAPEWCPLKWDAFFPKK